MDARDIGVIMVNAHSIWDMSWEGMKERIPRVVMNAYLCKTKSKSKEGNGKDEDHLDVFGYFGVEAIEQGQPVRSDQNKAAVSTIYRMLMVWAFADPELLFDAFIANDNESVAA
ncbi:hypothetical protein BKA70DRAFT_1422713 [Coprinopsis sp. MPI-PUGE-AT-0042]|nr:hypothetical protein BKA70DRAFT_1422713 [Coprinopsis sp. MPI-PUGE-AT-0042]